MIDKQYVLNNVSNIEKLPNVTILKMLMQFKEQLETSGAYHSITIGEVTTLEAEEPAYVENVGTTTDLVLNFGIPKGVGFNFSGEWVSDDNEYYPNDVVLYNGNLYICISTILDSETPPNIDIAHWSLFVGYGNDISEFIKSEYDKQLNLISEEVINISNYNIYWGYIYGLKPNTTYTFKTYGAYIGGSNLKLETKGGTLVQDIVTSWNLNLQSQVAKFTTNNSVNENEVYKLHLLGSYSASAVTRDCMLVEGDYTFDTMPSYQKYNGEIVHRKDLGVLLWENGNPNSIFNSQTITTLDMSIYSKIVIEFKPFWYDANQTTLLFEFAKNIDLSSFVLFGALSTKKITCSRGLTMTSQTTILVEDASAVFEANNLTTANERCIPIAIYGIK